MLGFLKSIGGKIVAGLVALAVVVAGISWWQMDPASRQALLSGAGRIVAWAGLVLVVPWLSFPLTSWVARRESNAAGAALVLILTALEALALAWLFEWSIPSATAWTFFVVGVLLAGIYNLFTCDWIAEKLE